MEEVIKKSYNPFKMWGSWIGFVIGILLIFLSPMFWIGYFILEEISISLVQGEGAFFGQGISFILNSSHKHPPDL